MTKRRQYRHFDLTVREQFGLELNAPLQQDALSAELMRRGFTTTAANDVATKPHREIGSDSVIAWGSCYATFAASVAALAVLTLHRDAFTNTYR